MASGNLDDLARQTSTSIEHMQGPHGRFCKVLLTGVRVLKISQVATDVEV